MFQTVTYSAAELKRAVKIVSANAAINTIVPAIESILFDVSPGHTQLTTTDLATTVSLSVASIGLDSFSFAISSKDMKDICEELPDGEVTLQFQEENHTVLINTGRGKHTRPVISRKEFPEIKHQEGDSNRTFTASSHLISRIRTAMKFTSKDDLRPAMTGVCLHFVAEKGLYVVTTDAHVLYRSEPLPFSFPKELEKDQFIIEHKAAAFLAAEISAHDFTVSFSSSHITISDGALLVSSRLIDAKFPPYLSVLPTDYTEHLIVNKDTFQGAVRFASMSANASTLALTFSLTDRYLNITASDQEFGKESAAQPVDISERNVRTDFNWAFNYKFLEKIISQIKGNIKILTSGTPTKAFIFHPGDSAELFLLMPLLTK